MKSTDNTDLENSLQNLLQALAEFGPISGGCDVVLWNPDFEHGFLVRSCVDLIISSKVVYGPVNFTNVAWKWLWKTDAPWKIKVFGWRVFRKRLPTRDLLMFRGIIPTDTNFNCVFCSSVEESMVHSFLACRVVRLIWREIREWIGFGDIFRLI